ncbi:MAG: TolC family protein [Armatimonadetes bacterium]|nr:TolC family protein [Armatimonadota bacterium]
MEARIGGGSFRDFKLLNFFPRRGISALCIFLLLLAAAGSTDAARPRKAPRAKAKKHRVVQAAPTPTPPATESAPGPLTLPLLTVDEALDTALKANRPLENARLEVIKAAKTATAYSSTFFPVIKADVKAGQSLTHSSVQFNQGAFGTFAATGPIPATDATISTPQRFTTFFVIAIAQPVTQLPKINLAYKAKLINTALAAEEVRSKRDATITDVKKAYAAILQAEAQLATNVETLKFFRELEKIVVDRYEQKTALLSEVLEVRKHVASSEVEVLQAEAALATDKQNLNLLLARDVHTAYRVREMGEGKLTGKSMAELEQIALQMRPQIRQAKLRVEQAKLEKRLAAAQYSPDVNLSLTYIRPYNVGLLPDKIVTVGAELTWVPVTWGKVLNETEAKAQAVAQAENDVAQVSSQVLIQVDTNYRTLQNNLQQVKAAKASLEAAREALRVAEVRYVEKVVLLSDVYQAQTRMVSAVKNYLQAVLSVNIAQAELQQSIGEE